ncbi:DegT/DnrJ/EryC1/StrS family aminotransferase [Paenibacillus faecalis]|uniref:DegT/DnrJ/EryC1/StrS family aminotransferase n=1 Tax=Paenibacillus faecalis TaxID=2079532 RepID=UPI000D0EB71E|nr:DegT/DnrJ/EryC1/StrS family aminotransferase [Paenibacillus faecalis]
MEIIPADAFIGTHYIGEEEERAVIEVMKAKSLFRYDGPKFLRKTKEFEKAMCDYLDVTNVLACSSGAAALKLCCIALGIGPGDEVLVPAFTFMASAGAVLNCGALPNFIEIDESMNIDPSKIEAHITSKTKAIMLVHIQGVPCNIDPIVEIANKHKLFIIEDVAQAFGAQYNRKYVGTIGDAAAFSLQANKVITSGEGGIFTCKSSKRFNLAKQYHDNGGIRINDGYPTWEDPESFFGENYKITEIQSAIANEQLNKANTIIENQRSLYQDLISGIDTNVYKLRSIPLKSNPVPVSLCFVFDTEDKCKYFIHLCKSNNVPIEKHWDHVLTTYNTFRYKKSWHKSAFPYTEDYKMNECPFTEEMIKRTAWFRISPLLTDGHIKRIHSVLEDIKTII